MFYMLIIIGVMFFPELCLSKGGLEVQPFYFPQTIAEGERVIVACTTKSGAPSGNQLSFKWLKDGKELGKKSSVKNFGDFSTMVIDPVSEEDSGNYTCIVSSDGLQDAFTAPLTVMVPPQWISIPVDKNSFAGDFLEMSCQASGKPPPAISWMKSEGIEGFAPLLSTEDVQIPSNGSFIILKVRKSHEGLYQCTATNSVGQSLKKVISISVSDHPRIQAFSFPNDVIVGQKASAACTAIAGDPPLQFRWLKNGKEISSGGQITIRTLVDVSVLVIEAVDASSSANYTCFLSTALGSDSYSAALEVKEPSKWENLLHDQDIKAGENITVPCKATGLPLPKVTWKKKIDSESEASTVVEQQQQISGMSRLLLLNSKPEDSGYYLCEANNNVGKPITRTIYINILEYIKSKGQLNVFRLISLISILGESVDLK